MLETTVMLSPTSGDVIIRRYVSADKLGVKAAFTSAMMTLAPNFLRKIYLAPLLIGVYATWLAMVLVVTHRSKDRFVLQTYSWWALAALLPPIALRIYIRSVFRSFLDKSLNGDLDDIEGVYECFLVAERDGKIVGTVGGEDKGDGVLELRRMTVDASVRNRGIGLRLIQALEKQVSPKKIYLSCSSVQYAAHRLYEKAGFVRVAIMIPERANIVFRSALSAYRYEKELS